MRLSPNCIFVFDLDDTLYSEYDFESSVMSFVVSELFSQTALNSCSKDDLLTQLLTEKRSGWVQYLIQHFPNNNYDKSHILGLYHGHKPKIKLYNDAFLLLEKLLKLNCVCYLVTDGKSDIQRKKVDVLGIEKYFHKIFISEEVGSEKLSGVAFFEIEQRWIGKTKVMFGDNPKKDFYTPNKLNWITVQLNNRGFNIHSSMHSDNLFNAKFYIRNFDDVKLQY